MVYEEKKFNLPDLKNISAKQIEIHLGLYAGYVKHVNLLREQLHELDSEKFAYASAETRRRLAFEFDGMRMHEYYFEQWEEGPRAANQDSPLGAAVSEKYGSWEKFIEHFKVVAGGTRGIGWTVAYWDPIGRTPHVAWVNDHENGHLATLPIILIMDMWEHAYMVDYTPSEKKQYITAFFENLNWSVPEERFNHSK